MGFQYWRSYDFSREGDRNMENYPKRVAVTWKISQACVEKAKKQKYKILIKGAKNKIIFMLPKSSIGASPNFKSLLKFSPKCFPGGGENCPRPSPPGSYDTGFQSAF